MLTLILLVIFNAKEVKNADFHIYINLFPKLLITILCA